MNPTTRMNNCTFRNPNSDDLLAPKSKEKIDDYNNL